MGDGDLSLITAGSDYFTSLLPAPSNGWDEVRIAAFITSVQCNYYFRKNVEIVLSFFNE